MTEKDANALLKARFENAGYTIAQNVTLDEQGVHFEIDGWDADKHVGYEYVTEEAGDSWDIDGDVIDALSAARRAGEMFVLVVNEADAPDERSLGKVADEFIASLTAKKPAAKKKPAAAKKPTAKKPAAKKK